MQARTAHLCVCIVALSSVLFVQPLAALDRSDCERDFQPHSGQPGKDVIWVPTPDALVQDMLAAAGTTEKDLVIDLGSGDGKIPITAAKKFGARAKGVEYNPDMVSLARCLAKAEGVENKVEIIQGDIFQTDFSAATVLTLYLLPDLNEKLRPTILKMRPGTRVVSHSFGMGDWEPDERLDSGQAYVWIVPAQVEGAWVLEPSDGSQSVRMEFEQTYQTIAGTADWGGRKEPVREPSLKGNEIAFTIVDGKGRQRALKGTVNKGQLQLTTIGRGKAVTYTGRRA